MVNHRQNAQKCAEIGGAIASILLIFDTVPFFKAPFHHVPIEENPESLRLRSGLLLKSC